MSHPYRPIKRSLKRDQGQYKPCKTIHIWEFYWDFHDWEVDETSFPPIEKDTKVIDFKPDFVCKKCNELIFYEEEIVSIKMPRFAKLFSVMLLYYRKSVANHQNTTGITGHDDITISDKTLSDGFTRGIWH